MRIGYLVQNQAAGAIAQVSSLAPELEAMGFDSLWATDHVVGVNAFAQHGYGPTWLEVLTSLAFMAAQTKRIRIGTSVLVAPMRDPVYAAKALATIDILSRGRLNVAIGTGWSKAEFHAVGRGAYHEARGPVTSEAIEVILRCWQGGEFDWQGEHFQFRTIAFDPVPVQRPHPPLLIGGPLAPPVMRRVKMFADALWHPTTTDVAALKDQKAQMSEFAGREVKVCNRLTFPTPPDDAELARLIAACAEMGCVETVVDLRSVDRDTALAGAERVLRAHRAIGLAG